jgi:hypothetical protein
MSSVWPYLLRLAISAYFIYPHVTALLSGAKKVGFSFAGCINEYIPNTALFTLWHGLFVALGVLILVWPRPILPLAAALLVLSVELFSNFSLHNYSPLSLLLFVLVLVTLALIIYHTRGER